MKKIYKILNIILLLTISFFLWHNVCYAATPTIGDITTGMKDVGNVDTSDTKISGMINIVIGIMQIVGTGIAIIVITMLGIKYTIASAQEKADLKKQATPIVIGCVLLFGAVNIVKIIADYGLNVK